MTKQQVIELLKFYPKIRQEIKMYTETLNQLEADWGVRGVSYSGGVPCSNNLSDVTADKTIKLVESGDGNMIREIESHIAYLKILQIEMFREIKKFR